jgi:hypothetical protein
MTNPSAATKKEPVRYSAELAEAICSRMENGESLRSICRDETMPSYQAVLKWRSNVEGFDERYALARQAQAHALVDELIEIADDSRNDWMERNDPENPGWIANVEHIQRTRVRLDTRKWLASKILPKVYGEKLELAGDAKAPLRVVVELVG